MLILSCSTDSSQVVDPHREAYNSELRAIETSSFQEEKLAPFESAALPSLDEAFYDPNYSVFAEQFLTRYTGAENISSIIISETRRNNLPISLTFSLAWTESRFNPKAVNWNESSVDRGLFQLNDRSFPELSEPQFFDPVVNARHGIAYLTYCLERGENEVVALAMYNAGPTRVSKRGAPLVTLDYINKIIEHREELNIQFQETCKTALAEAAMAKKPGKSAYVVDRRLRSQ